MNYSFDRYSATKIIKKTTISKDNAKKIKKLIHSGAGTLMYIGNGIRSIAEVDVDGEIVGSRLLRGEDEVAWQAVDDVRYVGLTITVYTAWMSIRQLNKGSKPSVLVR